jgi:hypothetical protein
MSMRDSSYRSLRRLLAGLVKVFFMVVSIYPGLAQAQTTELQIYTCTDARGRKLTSDRPITECYDREQKLLNPSGTVKGKLPPPLTASERTELELKEKAALEERARINEEKRRDRALMIRYPNRGVHDKERAEVVNQVGVVRQAAVNRVGELLRQRSEVTLEMEFYEKDPAKAPASLRRRAEESVQSIAIQNRFIADQDAELRRVNTRFDDELVRLKQLWALHSMTTPLATSKVP